MAAPRVLRRAKEFIPNRLRPPQRSSVDFADASRRAVHLYREVLKAIPEIRRIYNLVDLGEDEMKDRVRIVFREESAR